MEPLAVVMVVLAVLVLFFTVRAIVRRDRHAAEVRGLRSKEEFRAESEKAEEVWDRMTKESKGPGPGGL